MKLGNLIVLAVAVWITANAAVAGSLEGAWSAPSLSNRSVPIVFTVLPEGKATEQIGKYHGVGTWTAEGDAVRIFWASEWTGLLRPTRNGGFELLTWKKGTNPNDPPDDVQPARRVPQAEALFENQHEGPD